ncbi:MAG: hypothetical protein H7Y27_08280 [Gemmatimonadaceae bacterium]|nr:hypothetical protein [Chitinophagaceae bacterium]
MKLIKLGLISVVILFGVLTLIASFIPSQIRISRAVDMDSPRDSILNKIKSLRTWDNWNEYTKSYENKTFTDSTIRTDAVLITIVKTTDSSITCEWKQPSGRKFEAVFNVISHDFNNTTLQWYFDFKLRWYPWEKFQAIVYDQQLGPAMEKSLQNLKSFINQ